MFAVSLLCYYIYEPVQEKSVITTAVTSKGSGEPVHKRSLTRAFIVHRCVGGALRKLQAKGKYVISPIKRLPTSM